MTFDITGLIRARRDDPRTLKYEKHDSNVAQRVMLRTDHYPPAVHHGNAHDIIK